MHRSTDRILTTHTGSLPRPPELEQAMFDRGEGKEVAGLDELVARSMREVIERQVAVGVDVISDGEVGKPSYSTYVADRLDGFGGEADPLAVSNFAEHPEAAAALAVDPGMLHLQRATCVAPIALRDADAVHRDIAAFRAASEGTSATELFMTAVSPATIAMFFENRHYPDLDTYLAALADVMRPEYEAILDAGFTLQVDCPDLGCGHVMYAGTGHAEVARLIGAHVEVLNHALRGLPSDRIRVHVCWGNYEGPHHLDIELKDIVAQVLSLNADGISMEAANPRHGHEWQVWEEVALPDGKVLIPGVIDTATNFIEHSEFVAQRIETYAKVVGRENVIAGTDCGFGTFVGLRSTAPSVAWAKLETLRQGAELASRRLW